MTPPEPSRRSLPIWIVIAGLTAVYVVTARLGLLLALPPENKATAVWLPSGIAFAAVLLFGSRVWPGVWLGAFLANLYDYFAPANPFPLAAHLGVSAGIATGSTLQAVVGRALLRRWVGPGSPFDRTRSAFTYAAVALVMCLVAAGCGVVSLCLGGFAPLAAVPNIAWTWWLGDLTGVLTAGSLLLAWRRPPAFGWHPARLAEAAVLVVLTVLFAAIIFELGPIDFQFPPPLTYLTIPFLLWATFRFGLHGAATALCLISGIAVLGTSRGAGPFAQPTVQASLLYLQVYMAVLAVTALVVAATLAERLHAEGDLRQLNASLEQRVAQRTAALQESEERFRAVFEQSTDACFLRDEARLIVDANRRAWESLGYTREELIGQPISRFDPHIPAERLEWVNAELAAGRSVQFESRHRRKDGTEFPVEVWVGRVQAGGRTMHLSSAHDITERKRAEAELREAYADLRGIYDAFPDLYFWLDPDGTIRRYQAGTQTYVPPEQFLNRRMQDVLPPGVAAQMDDALTRVVATRVAAEIEYALPFPDGEQWFDARVQLLSNDQLLLVVRTITERKRAETALRESEERYRSVVESLAEGVAVFDPTGAIVACNERACHILALSRDQLTGRVPCDPRWQSLYEDGRPYPPDEYPVVTALRTGRPVFNTVMGVRTPAGPVTWVMINAAPIPDPNGGPGSVVASFHDISEARRLSDLVQASLREKETLLKEIHHRVKNNLQVVSTLLDLQSDHTRDPHALAMFRESRGRVKSMALIHERLYRSHDIARVNFAEYVRQLADDLYRAYKVTDDDIALELDVDIPPLSIDIAIPCGLLLNELVSNCFKHAFAEGAGGTIRVGLHRDEFGTNVLAVADDGGNFPTGLDFRNTSSFGLQLVNTLADQLNGELELTTGAWTTFTVRF